MRIDVVGAVLRVVLDDEDRGLRPELRVRHGLDDLAEGEVVVGDLCSRGGPAGAGAAGVVVWQPDDLQARHFALLLEAAQLGDETRGALHVGISHVEAAELRVDVALERGHFRRHRVAGFLAVRHELPVAAVGDTGFLRTVPEIAACGRGDGKRAFTRIRKFSTAVPVADRPALLHKVGGVSAHGPFVPVGADFALDVEVVEQDELAGERVMVGRDVFAEETQLTLAIPLRHVAEHLIVSAVLLDDVDAVFDRARVADFPRDGAAREICRGGAQAGVRPAGKGARGPLGELGFKCVADWEVDGRDGALEETADVFHDAADDLLSGHWAVAVGLGDGAFSIGDEEAFAVGREADAGGIPADRDEAEAARLAPHAEIEDGDGVDVGVGDKEALLVGGERERVRRVAGRRVGGERGDERLARQARGGVEHGDRVAVGIGDEEATAVLAQQHLIRVLLDGPARGDLKGARVDHGDLRLGPQRDVEAVALFIEREAVGKWVVGTGGVEQHFGTLGDGWVVGGRRGLERRGGVSLGQFEFIHIGGGFADADARDAVAPEIRGVDRGSIGAHSDTGGDAALLRLAQRERLVLAEEAGFEAETMNDFIARAGAQQAVAFAGEGDAVEGFVEPHA